MSALEREEDELVRAYNAGEISEREFRDGMRGIQDDIRDMAQQAAEEAHEEVMRRY